MPFLLVVNGGALGGGLVAVGLMLNLRVLRSRRSVLTRGLGIAAVTAGSFVVFLVGVVILQLAIEAMRARG